MVFDDKGKKGKGEKSISGLGRARKRAKEGMFWRQMLEARLFLQDQKGTIAREMGGSIVLTDPQYRSACFERSG